MRPYKSFLKEISYFSSVVILTGCASIIKSTQFPVATGLAVSANGKLGIIQENDINQSKVFDSYCSGSRQIKDLTINFTYYAPSKPKGRPLNIVSKQMSEISKKQQCDQRTILYSMSQKPECRNSGIYINKRQGRSTCSFNDPGYMFLSSTKNSSSFIENLKQTTPHYNSDSRYFLVKDDTGKLSFFNYFSQDSFSERIYNSPEDTLGDEVKSVYLASLNSLISNYTILEPLDFQKTTYFDEIEIEKQKRYENKSTEESICRLSDEYEAESVYINKDDQRESVEAFGIDEAGNIDVAKAIYHRPRIWKRYISRFSAIKESSVSSGVKNVQVSLDLNNFCRYGRSLEDVTSK
jgi:hypothetical protein